MVSKKAKLAFVLLLPVLMLAGCGIGVKKVLSNSQLKTEFNNNTRIMLSARGYAGNQVTNKKTKTVKLSKTNQEKVKKEQKEVQRSLNKLNNSRLLTGYPRSVKSYTEGVNKYLNLLLQDKISKKTLNKQFHQNTVKGMEIVSEYQNGKGSTLFNLALTADEASGYKPEVKSKGVTLKPTKTKNKSTVTHDPYKQLRKVKKQENEQNHIKKVNREPRVITLKIVLIALSALLILLIFLQPSKQDDAMNALSDTGGATLFTRPKPRGMQRLLINSTRVCTACIVVVLIVLNQLMK
ncbi:preprotein translocase subunit SecG [Limosilactobacillus reuteri]|uniref:preprotein translocase subunit SecG n=1 Tax=Limosilactobacillus reuteri TaxID=1598 RepID=UPI00155A6A19|nr:preprotein translocase subunit SecG [Limosilactobacillus reuteri]